MASEQMLTGSSDAAEENEDPKMPNVNGREHNEPTTEGAGCTLSNQEEQLYDRQIRLWGIEVQQRMMKARLLFLGKNGIHEETIKNLILAGMDVTLANDEHVTEDDVRYSFFLTSCDVGKPHAESLVKRMTDIVYNKDRLQFINSSLVKEKTHDGRESYEMDDSIVSSYDVISIAGESFPIPKLVPVNEKCRQEGIGFFACMANGIQGIIFQDLGDHTVHEKLSKEPGTITIQYRSLACILEEPKFPRNCDALIRKNVAYLLTQHAHPEIMKCPCPVESLDDKLRDICKKTGAAIEDVLPLFKSQGMMFPITSSVLGGYLALAIRNFVAKQYETAPSLCVFDSTRSIVTTAML